MLVTVGKKAFLCFPLLTYKVLPITKFMIVFPTPVKSLQHHLGVPQVSSFLSIILSTWSQHQILQVTGSVPQGCPHFRCQLQVRGCCFEWLAINQGSHDSLLGFDHLLEWLTELREPLTRLVTQGYDKGYRWTSRWKRCVGQSVGEGRMWGCKAPMPWLGESLSQYLHVFSYPEALWTAPSILRKF